MKNRPRELEVVKQSVETIANVTGMVTDTVALLNPTSL
jgi:hypothetical protein